MKQFQYFIGFFFLCGCGAPAPESHSPRSSFHLKVISTTPILDDIVGRIGGERVDHHSLIQGEIDPHSYELVKGDDEKLSSAQLIFFNGLGLEHGASLRYHLEHSSQALGVGNFLKEHFPQEILSIGSEIDPHVWMDIALWSRIIDPIVEALSRCDPEGKEGYVSRGATLKISLEKTHEALFTELQNVPEAKRYLVTSHDAFNYFTRAYLATPEESTQEEWQARFQAPEGLSPDGQLGVSDIQRIVAHLIKYEIHTLFPEANVSRDSLKKIVHAAGRLNFECAMSQGALYGDSMGNVESGGGTYERMMEHNGALLVKYWGTP